MTFYLTAKDGLCYPLQWTACDVVKPDHLTHLKNILFLDAYNSYFWSGTNISYTVFEEEIIRQDFPILFEEKTKQVLAIKETPKTKEIEEYVEEKAIRYIRNIRK